MYLNACLLHVSAERPHPETLPLPVIASSRHANTQSDVSGSDVRERVYLCSTAVNRVRDRTGSDSDASVNGRITRRYYNTVCSAHNTTQPNTTPRTGEMRSLSFRWI